MELTLEEVFEAYFNCRKTKRYSKGALDFEIDYESKLVELYNDLKNDTYEIGTSTCFIITKPVRREVFAAPFRDRIVHHILINRLNPYFEKYFIFDSYACRVGKGTLKATKRAEHFMRSVSQNGSKQAYILKLDIKGFFMSINKHILYEKLINFIEINYQEKDVSFEKKLCKKIIYNDPCKNCIKRSKSSEWDLLPKDKSLFTTKQNCFHNDKQELLKIIPLIKIFLQCELKLTLHPKKVYLQEVSKGVEFLGVYINPYYTNRSKRVKKSFIESIKRYNSEIEKKRPNKTMLLHFLASVNSYLGILRHYKTYRFRTEILTKVLDSRWKKIFSIKKNALKLEKK